MKTELIKQWEQFKTQHSITINFEDWLIDVKIKELQKSQKELLEDAYSAGFEKGHNLGWYKKMAETTYGFEEYLKSLNSD